MNTTHRRRGRRPLAAILAAMLMASVLAVVAGSPAQAANTSSEALVDTNDDGVGDAREFGGRDRYDTSLRLAKNFAKARGGIGGVADFIEDYGVDTVHVLGGSGAVADSVLEDMEALANEPTVSRIEGVDRYATAAAIASKLGGAASWCGGDAVAALLVSGEASELINAVIAGPIAHRLQLPVLLTAGDELPLATTDFVEAEDVEHVVIVGGTDSVSEDIESALTNAGVDTITRIADDTLPASVRDFLVATPAELDNGDKINLSVVAIGGTGVVSDSVMAAATEAAASADKLTVNISGSASDADAPLNAHDAAAEAGEDPGRTFWLHFSDDIAVKDVETKIRDILEVNGVPARLGVLDVDVEDYPPADTTRPAVAIQALVGQPGFIVMIADSEGDEVRSTLDADDLRVFNEKHDIVFDARDDNEIASITSAEGIADGGQRAELLYIVLLGTEDGVQMLLEVGDRITVKNAVFEDGDGNRNRSVTVTAVLPPEDPKVTTVHMSRQYHSQHAAVRIDDGEVKYDDFVNAMNDHSGFSALFTAANNSTETTATEPCGKNVNKNLRLKDLTRQVEHNADRLTTNDGTPAVDDTAAVANDDDEITGVTEVRIEVTFNGYVQQILEPALFFDVFASTLDRNKIKLDADEDGTVDGGKDAVLADDTVDPVIEAADAVQDIAVGFIDDEDTTPEDERLNASSQHLIFVNSSVKAAGEPTE